MKKLNASQTTLILLSTLILVVMGFSTSSYAQGRKIENWSVACLQGFCEFVVRNGPGNSFNISCDVASRKPGNVNIFVSIAGKSPPRNSTLRVFADGEEYNLCVDKDRNVVTDAHVCATNYYHFLERLKNSNQLIVIYSNGPAITFQTRGGSNILPDTKECPGGFFSP